ncbi:MAG: serine/threonine protein kinase [Planctomycetes bacterium]|nr:serine/threonine protein kinase [Planctomycetota bacterium]
MRDASRKTPTQEQAPERLGEYEILRELGRGGMGVVYLARQPSLDRTVAVKVLAEQYSRDETFVKRFQREARAAARLVHPNVIQIFTVGNEGDTHFFAMEFVDGQDLTARVRAGEKLGIERVAEIGVQTARALQGAHEAGIVHRDIKPSNIVIDRHGTVKVMDFGLAKALSEETVQVTVPGMVMGTVNYMSPEQGRGETLDTRSDLYSLGIVLFELLTGRVPFQTDTPTAAIYMHIHEPPPRPREYNPEIPEALEAIVLRLLAKSPAARYQTPNDLAADLARFQRGEPLAQMNTMMIGKDPSGVSASAATMDLTPASARARALSDEKRLSEAKPGKRPLRIVAGLLAIAAVAIAGAILALRDEEPPPAPSPGPAPAPPNPVPTPDPVPTPIPTPAPGPTSRTVDLRALLERHDPRGEHEMLLDGRIQTGQRSSLPLAPGRHPLALRRPFWTDLTAVLVVPEGDAPCTIEGIESGRRKDAEILREVQRLIEALGEGPDDAEAFARGLYEESPFPSGVRAAIDLGRALAQARTLMTRRDWAGVVSILQPFSVDRTASDLLREAQREIDREGAAQGEERARLAQEVARAMEACRSALARGQYDIASGELGKIEALAADALTPIQRQDAASARERVGEATSLWTAAQEIARAPERREEARTTLGRLLALSPEFGPAQELLRSLQGPTMTEQQERQRQQRLQEARDALGAGDLVRCETALQEILRIAPGDPEAISLRRIWSQRTLLERFDRALRDRALDDYLACIDPESDFGRLERARARIFFTEGTPIALDSSRMTPLDLNAEAGRARIHWEARLTVEGRPVPVERVLTLTLVERGPGWLVSSCESTSDPEARR